MELAFKGLIFVALIATALGSGDLGDFGKAQEKLSEDVIATYYTEDKVVGRDMPEGQCSERVLRQRQKTMDNVREFAQRFQIQLKRHFKFQ